MVNCKDCQGKKIVKNGCVRGVQRYKCKACGLNFIEGDKRFKRETTVKKALCVLLLQPWKSLIFNAWQNFRPLTLPHLSLDRQSDG